MRARQPRLALALGGGAALGYAHLGVLQALDEADLWRQVDLVVGTSMGALVGAAALAAPTLHEVARRFRVALEDPYLYDQDFDYLMERRDLSVLEQWLSRVRRGLMLTQTMVRDSLVDGETFDRMLRALLPARRVEDLPREFACISTNVTERRRHLWTTGPLLESVAASCAIPGILPSRHLGKTLHVDGGAVERVPVPTAFALGATFVVAVAVEAPAHRSAPESAAELFVAASNITAEHLTALQLRRASYVVRPDVGDLHWADFRRFEEVVTRGYEAGCAAVEEIAALWQDHKRRFAKGVRLWRRATHG